MAESNIKFANDLRDLASCVENSYGPVPSFTRIDIYPQSLEELTNAVASFGKEYTVRKPDPVNGKYVEIIKLFGSIQLVIFARAELWGKPTEVVEQTTKKIYPIPEEILSHASESDRAKLTASV